MGMVDSFHDEDAECPKCHTKVTEWQTKDLERLGEYWERGDFVQYRKLERIPEKERKREYGDSPFPLYAKILDGRFAEIVEVEAGVEAKQRVLIKLETTAQTLRADYEKKLSQLQESCSHKKTKWMDLAWAPVLYYGRALVCLRCEKRLKLKRGWESLRAITPKQTKHLRNKKDKENSSIDKKFRNIAEKNLRKDRELLEKLAKI